jgi:hypothetical protein
MATLAPLVVEDLVVSMCIHADLGWVEWPGSDLNSH